MSVFEKQYLSFTSYEHFKSILFAEKYDFYINDSYGMIKVEMGYLFYHSDDNIREHYEKVGFKLYYVDEEGNKYKEAIDYIHSL